MRQREKRLCYQKAMILLACAVAVGDSMSASTPLAPKTNTGLTNIHLKAVRCNEQGRWSFDVVNNAFVGAHIEYFFWLEDDDADAIESDAGQLRLDPKSRETAELVFSCEVPFTELRQHFQWAPTGFTRQ